MHPPIFFFTVQFVFWFVLGIPLAIGNVFLARRLGRSVAGWVILSLIPLVNMVFMYYVGYRVIYGVFDRLAAITDDMKRLAAG